MRSGQVEVSSGGPNLRTAPGAGQQPHTWEVAGSCGSAVLSPAVDREKELARLLAASSDRDNPSPQALVQLLGEVRRIDVLGLIYGGR